MCVCVHVSVCAHVCVRVCLHTHVCACAFPQQNKQRSEAEPALDQDSFSLNPNQLFRLSCKKAKRLHIFLLSPFN